MPINKIMFASFLIIFCLIFISPLSAEPKTLYELYSKVNCLPYNYDDHLCNSYFENYYVDRKYESEKLLNYKTKFSHLPPPIQDNELKTYENKAKENNIDAMFALYRYYMNPKATYYNEFETEARQWLLKAIKLGSEEAMLEMGFNRPYAQTTKLEHNNFKAEIISNCENIENYKTNCFLYRLKITNNNQAPTYYTILNSNYKNTEAVSPRYINIRENNKDIILELISDNSEESKIRKDYFNLAGNYLGADSLEAKPDYFYNFTAFSPLFKNLTFNLNKESKILSEIKINIYPFYNSFVVEEEKNHILLMSTYNPSFTVTERGYNTSHYSSFNSNAPYSKNSKDQPYLQINQEEFKTSVTKFKAKYGYLPLSMPSIIYYNNLNEYLEKAKKGDLYAYKLLEQLYDNPTSFVYNKPFPDDIGKIFDNIYRSRFAKNPYIAVTNSILPDDRKLKILTMCDSKDYTNFDNSALDDNLRAHCYAMQITLENSGEYNYYYLFNEESIVRNYDNFAEMENTFKLGNCELDFNIYGDKKLLHLICTSWSGSRSPGIVLDFDQYNSSLFDGSENQSNKYLFKNLQIDKENTHDDFFYEDLEKYNADKSVSLDLNIRPSWEDIKIEEMEK